MATPPVINKSSSRWGSFLQQAVAGVESRLDTILADEDSSATGTAKPNGKPVEQPGKRETMAVPNFTRPSMEGLSRTASNNKKNDRLQERLAKTLANRNSAKLDVNSTTTSTAPSRTASPFQGLTSSRVSLDASREDEVLQPNGHDQSGIDLSVSSKIAASETMQSGKTDSMNIPALVVEQDTPGRLSLDSFTTQSPRSSLDVAWARSDISETPSLQTDVGDTSFRTPAPYEEELEQMRSDYKAAELRRQEEMHEHLERIDALQAKLQYLTKEATKIAKRASSEAETGSLEQKLAVKDEKIVLLMEEGQNLSQTELKHMTTIKKLRVNSIDDGKRINDLKRGVERQGKVIREAQERAKRAEAVEKREAEIIKHLQQVEKDFERMKAENESRSLEIENLKSRLASAKSTGEAEDIKKYKDLLESERKTTAELRDDISNAKIEKELSEDRHRAHIRELQETSNREKDRAKMTELELQGELGVLESRLETLRARAEEASTGSTGGTQAKLLRQIETLQTQYSVASENWQGIEYSLLSRVTSLERERDDIAKREADVRRKAREASIKSRKLEEELEKSTIKLDGMEIELAEQITRLKTLQEQLIKAETEVANVRTEMKVERQSWHTRLASLEEEKAERKEYIPQTPETTYQHFRAESPVRRTRQKSKADKSPNSRRNQGISGLGLTGTSMPFVERPTSRRPSGQTLQTSGFGTPYRNNSLTSTPQLSVNGGISETPMVLAEQQDDFFDGVATPGTPERTINDMISVSTAGAGPSVQLVERMSAAVRRLESEKAASKDELSRLSAQREEARAQVVELMREVEEKRAGDQRIKVLEADVSQINQRYQTTLEMLGEKSELVEELRADVADVKQMYRELVDSTMR